jgi:aminoglycoside phosphotransferase (APT) family kinase protein
MSESVPGINFDTLLPWFRDNVAQVDDLHATVIGHGRSNITYRLSAGDDQWVLRRPPLARVLPTAHDMKREFRVISAMKGTDVPAPEAIALCEDTAVTGAPFYIMSFVDGYIPLDPNDVAQRYNEDMRRHMGEHLVDVLAALHALDPASVGLADFGKPQGYIGRQVRRFTEQVETTLTRETPELKELAKRLAAAVPEESDGTIVHGDYRLDNAIMNDFGDVIAVLDWEMATLGDPLADVGILYMYWGDAANTGRPSRPGDNASTTVISLPGFPSWTDALERYARKSGRNVDHLDFYIVLAHFKLAVIVEGIRERFEKGGTVGEGFEGMAARATALARSGLNLADRSTVPALRG